MYLVYEIKYVELLYTYNTSMDLQERIDDLLRGRIRMGAGKPMKKASKASKGSRKESKKGSRKQLPLSSIHLY